MKHLVTTFAVTTLLMTGPTVLSAFAQTADMNSINPDNNTNVSTPTSPDPDSATTTVHKKPSRHRHHPLKKNHKAKMNTDEPQQTEDNMTPPDNGQ